MRLGDPEAQAILPRLAPGEFLRLHGHGYGQHRSAVGWRGLAALRLQTLPGATCAVVLAAPGYPDEPRLGGMITIDAGRLQQAGVTLFHNGTRAWWALPRCRWPADACSPSSDMGRIWRRRGGLPIAGWRPSTSRDAAARRHRPVELAHRYPPQRHPQRHPRRQPIKEVPVHPRALCRARSWLGGPLVRCALRAPQPVLRRQAYRRWSVCASAGSHAYGGASVGAYLGSRLRNGQSLPLPRSPCRGVGARRW